MIIETGDDMKGGNARGDDCLTTFLAGCIGLVVFGTLVILLLSWIFD